LEDEKSAIRILHDAYFQSISINVIPHALTLPMHRVNQLDQRADSHLFRAVFLIFPLFYLKLYIFLLYQQKYYCSPLASTVMMVRQYAEDVMLPSGQLSKRSPQC